MTLRRVCVELDDQRRAALPSPDRFVLGSLTYRRYNPINGSYEHHEANCDLPGLELSAPKNQILTATHPQQQQKPEPAHPAEHAPKTAPPQAPRQN